MICFERTLLLNVFGKDTCLRDFSVIFEGKFSRKKFCSQIPRKPLKVNLYQKLPAIFSYTNILENESPESVENKNKIVILLTNKTKRKERQNLSHTKNCIDTWDRNQREEKNISNLKFSFSKMCVYDKVKQTANRERKLI